MTFSDYHIPRCPRAVRREIRAMRDLWILHRALAGTALRIVRFVLHVSSASWHPHRHLCFHHNYNISWVRNISFEKIRKDCIYITFFFSFVSLIDLSFSLYILFVRAMLNEKNNFSGSERMFKVKLANNDICHVNGDVNRRKLMYRAKAKSLRISIVIVTAFIFWWTPYYTMMIIFMFSCPDKHVSILS